MNILSLDVGRRRTGAAFVDESIGVPLALDTIQHQSIDDLVDAVQTIVAAKKIDRIVCGLPLLPSGGEGEQSAFVREVASVLTEKNLRVVFLDERYTTDRSAMSDGDAKAALEVLTIYLQRSSAQ